MLRVQLDYDKGNVFLHTDSASMSVIRTKLLQCKIRPVML